MAERTNELHPIAIVVTNDLYASDRVRFTRLATHAGSPLLVWTDDGSSEGLETALRGLVTRSKSRVG